MQLKNQKTRYSPNFAYTADDVAAVELEKYGEYRQREINLLANLIAEDDTATTVWDVGAGCGVHTLALSRHAAIVVAFEHNKDKAHALGMNTTGKLGPNIKVVTEHIGSGKDNTHKLDGFLMKTPEPSIVRIANGNSLDALKGAKALMMIVKPIMFIDVHGLESIAEHYKILQKLDYKLWWYGCPEYNENNYKEVSEEVVDNPLSFSILAIHKHVGGAAQLDLPEVLGSNDTYARFYTTR